jgi:predicted anti-sigma-YlaC factor YlaD
MSYKMPIILNIRKNKGGTGLDLSSLYLEASACTANFYYNCAKKNPITTYGDVFSANVQNIAIIGLVWMYGLKDNSITPIHVGAILSAALGFMTAMLKAPERALPYVASYGVYMITVSRIPQIISNIKTGDVGVQSLFTTLNAMLGSLAKVVMALVETPDFVLLSGAAVTFFCNATLLFQVLTMPSKDGVKKKSD